MFEIRWRRRALDDLSRIFLWLSDNGHADANRVIMRIRLAAESLARLGDIGRPSRVRGVRELSVRTAPYVIAYVVDGSTIDILAVYHTAQQR